MSLNCFQNEEKPIFQLFLYQNRISNSQNNKTEWNIFYHENTRRELQHRKIKLFD